MRFRLQNRQKRRKLLGLAQYRREHAVEERRMQAYLGKKSRHWWRLKIWKNTKSSWLPHLQGEPHQGRGFGQFLCAPPRFWTILRPKPQKMFLRNPPKNWNHGTAKRKKRKRHNWPLNRKNQKKMPVLRRAFAGKENSKTQWRTNATSQDGWTDVLPLADVFENFRWKSLPGSGALL